MKKNLLSIFVILALIFSVSKLQAQTEKKKVAYITADREFMLGASEVTDDAIIKLLQADDLFEVTVMAVAQDSVFDNLGEFDLAVVQESFYSTAAILKPEGSAALAKIPVPFIYTKMWALKTGRALTSGGNNGGAEAAGVAITVDASNQSNELFNAITFTDNKFDIFLSGSDGKGGEGDVALNYADGISLSDKNTLLGTCAEITEPDSTIFLNDFPSGSQVGSETLAARMIAIGTNFGAVIKDDGKNFTQNGITLWRNALYSLAGLTVPSTPAELPDEDVDLCFNIDFGAGSNITDEPGWNNMFMESLETQKVELVNSLGDSTGIMAYFHDDMAGINSGGTTNPHEDLDLPITAASDNLYCNGTNRTAGITFENLDQDSVYSFEMFASRMGATDNRETKYTFEGMNTGTGYLNPSDNDSLTAVVEGIKPNAEGKIIMTIDIGENHEQTYYYIYLGAMRITMGGTHTAINDFSTEVDRLKVYPVPFSNKLNIANVTSSSQVSVYSITGSKVLEVQASSDIVELNTSSLRPGIYTVRVTDDRAVVGAYKVIKK